MRNLPFWKLSLFYAIAILAPLVAMCAVAEIVLRFLPVSTLATLRTQPVNEKTPIFRATPNTPFVYSRKWNFAMRNEGRTNAQGFINAVDYVRDPATPLLSIVGDSYVEALMVPYSSSLTGRLQRRVGPDGRVYFFALSGAPLSQYLAWAEYAARNYNHAAAVFVIIARIDHAIESLRTLLHQRPARNYQGNVLSSASPEKHKLSQHAVDFFLNNVARMSGLPRDRILFVLDGFRHEIERGEQVDATGYAARMLTYFKAEAQTRGFELVDMHPIFEADYRENRKTFQYPIDAHWNGHAHGLAARAITSSNVFRETFKRLTRQPQRGPLPASPAPRRT